MENTRCFFAVDLGATSGRTIAGTLADGKVRLEELTRFPNNLIETGGHFYWDIYALYFEIIKGLKQAVRRGLQVESIGIDTWGVDFVCVGDDGALLRNPLSYRDPHTFGAMEEYDFSYRGYDGPSRTPAEKEASFLRMLDKLESGERYMFIDHPALDNDEMRTVGHIGYEHVAADRQGVTDLLTSDRVKQALREKGIKLISYNDLTKSLPRGESSKAMDKAFDKYLKAVADAGQDLHSIMIVQRGKVIKERWMGEGAWNKPHVLNSVSKTFTATAVGFAVAEGKLRLTDKVISFFPDQLPAEISPNLEKLEVCHLLTMSSGHDVDPTPLTRGEDSQELDWVRTFLAAPLTHEPGTFFVYNSLGTYMLSAIVQKVTGEKVIDYLYPRLFRPLGIVGATWQESPQGINCGGWGLYLKTEDLAKMGQLFLQKGTWNGKRLLPESWIDEATRSHIASLPAGTRREELTIKPKDSDWLQGYGYQMWRCRHDAVRADGANGQYIIILPEQEAVIAMTANIGDMQAEINLVWKYLLPALR